MPEQPPPDLAATLQDLRLVNSGRLESVAPIARRLAGGLPLFDAVWLDALVQARDISPFQAAQISSGRSAKLVVGPFVLVNRIGSLGYGDLFVARHRQTQNAVRLAVCPISQAEAAGVAQRLRSAVHAEREVRQCAIDLPQEAGHSDGCVWAAYATTENRTAQRWMVEHGRMPPEVVLAIAREMAASLLELERHNLVHGDVGATSLLLLADRTIVMSHAGLRPWVRPSEGYAYDDLPTQSYDYVAPERITHGAPIRTATEVFSCGALWWHLLAGRPPFAGGDTLAKLQAIHRGRVEPIGALAPETPEILAGVVTSCLQSEPANRPRSFSQLVEQLGAPTRHSAQALAKYLASPRLQLAHRHHPLPQGKLQRRARTALAASLVAMLLVGLFYAPAGYRLLRGRRSAIVPAITASTSARDSQSQPLTAAPRVAAKTGAARADFPVVRASYLNKQAPAVRLPVDRVLRLETLRLLEGQVVSGQGGRRPQIEVPAGGLLITAENVRLENIDFYASPEPAPGDRDTPHAMIRLSANRAEFRGCSFRIKSPSAQQGSAIVWKKSAAVPGIAADGELVLTRCFAKDVSSFVDYQREGAASVKITNTLQVDAGPLMLLRRSLRIEEPLNVTLERVTIRGRSRVLELQAQPEATEPGLLAICALDSVFAPEDGEPLILVTGKGDANAILRAAEWSGQGSLATPGAVFAAARTDGRLRSIADADMAVAGLVRSQVQFKGDKDGPPAESELVDWQAPLQSTEPPGIEASLSEDHAPVSP